MLVDDRAGGFGGDAQRRRQLAIVDLMVFRRPHGAGELAGEVRLAPARLGGGNPLQRQAELFLMGKMMVDARLVVGGQRDDQRSFRAQFDVDAGRLQQFRREGRPARLALASERDQRVLAGFGFAAGREHPGGGMARAAAGRAAVEDVDASLPARQAATQCQGRSPRRR